MAKAVIKELDNGFMKEGADVKLRYSLIPAEVDEELARILTYGAAKYAPNNWKKCKDSSYYEDALFRHLQCYRKGEHIDPESGFHHLSHALCNLAFLVYFEVTNDRTANASKNDKIPGE